MPECITTTQPDSGVVDQFYSGYSPLFVIPHERESLNGLRSCLALNGESGASLRARFGPSREWLLVLREPGKQATAAGANFLCFPMPDQNCVTVQTNYEFVAMAARGRGYLHRLYEAMERVAWRFAAGYGLERGRSKMIFIAEQNDPFRMTLSSYHADTVAGGLDQFDRLTVAAHSQTKVLDFPYVLPALSEDRIDTSTLFLRARFCGGTERHLDASILREHLLRFFAISVLKGRKHPRVHTGSREQLSRLDRMMAKDGRVATYAMPSSERIKAWKAQVRRHSAPFADVPVGRLLGLDSMAEALRPQDAARGVVPISPVRRSLGVPVMAM